MPGVPAFRKVGTVLVAILLGYVAFHLIATRSNMRHWNAACLDGLVNLHRSWVQDGQPEQYDAARYYGSHSPIVRFHSDTNHYSVSGQSVKGLFRAEYAWDGESVVFLVTRDGTVFQQQDKQHLKQINRGKGSWEGGKGSVLTIDNDK